MAVGQAMGCSNTMDPGFAVSQLDTADDWLIMIDD